MSRPAGARDFYLIQNVQTGWSKGFLSNPKCPDRLEQEIFILSKMSRPTGARDFYLVQNDQTVWSKRFLSSPKCPDRLEQEIFF
jgi:hypothetical protein